LKRLARLLKRVLTLGGIGLIVTYVALFLAPLPAPPPVGAVPESTKILDREGRLLYDSAGPGDAHHTDVPLAEIPLPLRQAIIATEDASFYSNPGIDLKAIGRAAVTDLLAGGPRQGGSTITQQLVRNLYFDSRERSSANPLRKLNEIVLALRLDRSMSKDQILEQYLNRIYFGNLAYGVEAASRTYFAKSARDLDVAESALLAGLPQAPANYDPFTQMDAAKARQRIVLDRMSAEGYISAEEASAAFAEPLSISRQPFPMRAPHFTAWVIEQLPGLIGEDAVAGGDLRVYTSLDLDLQDSAQAVVARHVGELKDRNVSNGAVVAVDPRTGEILAMVGSADYYNDSIDGAVNMALAERQPGSSIKPILYSAALEDGFTPASPLLDVPTTLPDRHGNPYSPNNYDSTFHGVVPLREALASSYNVPAVRVLASVGIDRVVELGRRLGITSFKDPSRYDLSLTLGGGEVRLLDLTVAYAGLASGGQRVNPVAILRVENGKGDVIYGAPQGSREQVVSGDTAYLIGDILSDNDARAPTFGLDSPLKLSRPAAAKTGTTSEFRDNWTVGFTQELAVGVWVGNADNTAMRRVSGIDGAAPIWHDVMEAGLQGVTPVPLSTPAGIRTLAVCVPSGLLPTPYCPRQRIEKFSAGTEPVKSDDYYRPVAVCGSSGASVSSDAACPGGAVEKVYAFVPIEAVPWARAAGVPLPPVPPYTSGAATVHAPENSATGCAGVSLVSPANAAVFRLSREIRVGDQMLRIEALPSCPVRDVEFYVDQTVVGSAQDAPYKVDWQLTEGVHEIRARTIDADNREAWTQKASVTVLSP
jgi:1A family penicillin-binding protein